MIKLRFANVVPGMHLSHGIAGVVTWAAAQIADLLGEQFFDARLIRVGKASAENRVGGDAVDKRIGYRGHTGFCP